MSYLIGHKESYWSQDICLEETCLTSTCSSKILRGIRTDFDLKLYKYFSDLCVKANKKLNALCQIAVICLLGQKFC